MPNCAAACDKLPFALFDGFLDEIFLHLVQGLQRSVFFTFFVCGWSILSRNFCQLQIFSFQQISI